MLDQIISAAANFALASTGLLVARAYYPRNGWPTAPAARAFHAGFFITALATALNAGAWFIYRVVSMAGAESAAAIMAQAFRYGDGFWKVAGAAAFVLLLLAKLRALDPEDRESWNLVTVAFHPDEAALAVRICGAMARPFTRDKDL